METTPVVTKSKKSYDALARLLHIQPEKIVEFATKKKHPLPLPGPLHIEADNSLPGPYRRALKTWFIEEQKDWDNQDAKSCIWFLEHMSREQEWSIDNTLNDFPPGHFLG